MTTATAEPPTWKGFRLDGLEKRFGITTGMIGIRVPYFDADGTLHRVKLFPLPEDDWENAKGKPLPMRWLGPKRPQIPYGLWRLPKEGKVLILTEGESDYLALASYLPKISALGIPGAASWKPDWMAYVAAFERVFIAADGDRAGAEFADRVFADVPDARLVLMPEGADTRALLQKLGARAFVSLLTAAEATYRIRATMAAGTDALRTADAVKAAWDDIHIGRGDMRGLRLEEGDGDED